MQFNILKHPFNGLKY